MNYDIAVIGAGPSRIMAAGERDAEAEPFYWERGNPGHKVCAEGVLIALY